MMRLKNLLAVAPLAVLLVACGGNGSADAPPVRSASVLAAVAGSTASAYDYHVVVQQLYVAYFGRPADSAGLAFYEAALAAAGAPTNATQLSQAYASNAAVRSVFDGFSNSAESQALYSGDTQAFVTAVYQNLFNRTPEPDGLSFWSAAIDSGTLTRSNAALSILAGAQGNDAATVKNKVLVSSNFTAAMTAPAYVSGYQGAAASAVARSLLGQVDNWTDVTAFQTQVAATLVEFSYTASLQPAALQWNWTTTSRLALTDATGAAASTTGVTCTAADPTALVVAANCSSVQALRLGTQQVLISGPNIVATATVSITPQHQPFGTHSPTGSVGNSYNLVVGADGSVQAWGSNQQGVLGQGRSPLDLLYQSLPVAVHNIDDSGNLSGIVSASAGASDAMALTSDGQVLAWGEGHRFGRAASGYLPSYVPNSYNAGNLQHIVQLSVGQANAAALADDGTVYTWGLDNGQGSAILANLPYPVTAPSGTGFLSSIVAISSGSDFTLALAADGRVYAWGDNLLGQTGRGTLTGEEVLPATVQLASDGSDLHNIVAISAGATFALALTSDGHVYAWGDNSHGQLGQIQVAANFPRAVPVKNVAGTDNLTGIKMVSAGGAHALALDTTGKVYGWGLAANGQIGDGTGNPAGVQAWLPQAVVGVGSTGQLSGIASLAAGDMHSVALATDGSVLIWGDGRTGNLGQGAGSPALSRVPLTVLNAAGTAKLTISPLSGFLNLTMHGR